MGSYCNGNDFFEPRFESESFRNLEMTYCILHIAGNLKTHIIIQVKPKLQFGSPHAK